jgi:porphobilinogen deaminase
MLPAPGQGVIALQIVKPKTIREENLQSILSSKNHLDTWYCAMAEKYMLEAINGDCHTPIFCLSYIEGNRIGMISKNFETDKLGIIRKGLPADYKELGYELGSQLIWKKKHYKYTKK